MAHDWLTFPSQCEYRAKETSSDLSNHLRYKILKGYYGYGYYAFPQLWSFEPNPEHSKTNNCLANPAMLSPPLAVPVFFSSAACSTGRDWPLVVHAVHYMTSEQHLSDSLIERWAYVVFKGMKIIPLQFLNTPVYCKTLIPPKSTWDVCDKS